MDILTRNCRQLFHIQEILLLNYQDIKLQSMQVIQIPTESHFFAVLGKIIQESIADLIIASLFILIIFMLS